MLRANDPKDEDLVSRARSGDRAALTVLVTRYERAAFHLALGLLGHREDALDVVQSAILKMIQSLDTLAQPPRFGSWFLRIVRNKALDLSGQRRRRRTSSLEAEGCSSTAEPADALAAEEALAQLRGAMRGLSDDHRTVIALRYGRDLDYATIATHLGVPQSTVRSRLYEARLILKARLGVLNPGIPKSPRADQDRQR